MSEIIGRLVGQTMRPLPTTTEGWLIQISGDVQATQLSVTTTNDKIDRLIEGAVRLDGRLDTIEAWRERVQDDVRQLPAILDWQKGVDGQMRGIKFSVAMVSGLIGTICGLIGATVAVLTNLASAFGGKHP